MKGCCFIKFRDDAIFPLFSPQSPSCLCFIKLLYWLSFQGFHTLHSFMRKKQQKETDLLLRTEEGEDGLKELNFWDSFPPFFSS